MSPAADGEEDIIRSKSRVDDPVVEPDVLQVLQCKHCTAPQLDNSSTTEIKSEGGSCVGIYGGGSAVAATIANMDE